MTDEQRKFLQLVTPAALESERRWQIPAAITIAQAILESGWGRSALFLQALNPFGIKHRASDPLEQYVEFPTRERLQDKWQTVRGEFASFPTLAEAFLRHSRLLWTGHYRDVVAQLHGDPSTRLQRVAQAIQDCGYSTDPGYAAKLLQLIRQYHLDDPEQLAALNTAIPDKPGSLSGAPAPKESKSA